MNETSKRTFKITPFEAKTLSWWRTRRAKIDMDPPYQRKGGLWPEADKAYLIDSILNGYDIPKLYMADFTWGDSSLNKKKLAYAIIDGKQRMEAIFDFFDGKITLADEFIYLDNPALRLAGLGYPDLVKNHPEVAEQFDNFNLSVMSVMAQDAEPISELFTRLNRSKALTGAEKRNAMSGPIPGLISEIAHHEFFNTNVKFTTVRGQDLNAAAKIFAFEYSKKITETKKKNLDSMVRQAEKIDHDQLELCTRRALDVLSDMAAIFLPDDKLLKSAGVFPVYYWLIRNTDKIKLPKIRVFLSNFERERSENRTRQEKNPNDPAIDTELLEYDRHNRSTDDIKSHQRRYEILKSRMG